jgi:Fe-S oxidoreductase
MTASLRYGSSYVGPDLATTFDFSADGGMLQAAELCAGVGECRKTRGGTMCPSYQATRDERDSTRGRANALRLAITGQMGFQGFTDPHLHDVLDLCLECKACKGECPTNVDMARLKAEFLHQYHRKNGLPLRNRVFGQVAHLSRWGCRLSPLSNWMAQSRIMRRLNEAWLGIDRRRLPPAFASGSLAQRHAKLPPADPPGPGATRIWLFPDTFTSYHEPELGMSAFDLLQRAGGSVALAPTSLRCCGRPLISNGMLTEAVANARHNVEQLHDWARSGGSIVACEPSCLLTIKDDYPALLRNEERTRAEIVASACLTLEECLERLLARGDDHPPSRLSFRPGPKRILVQGHCHQRSLVGMGPLLRLLGRVPGAEVVDLDAGCCGLAGSFGYETEHYEISRLVGEQRLFPAIRNAGPEPDTVIVAPGFSCRLQIAHFNGRAAVAPAMILHSLLPT